MITIPIQSCIVAKKEGDNNRSGRRRYQLLRIVNGHIFSRVQQYEPFTPSQRKKFADKSRRVMIRKIGNWVK